MFTNSKVFALRILSNSNCLRFEDVRCTYLMHDNMKLRMLSEHHNLNYSCHYLLSIQGEYFHVYKNTYIHYVFVFTTYFVLLTRQ